MTAAPTAGLEVRVLAAAHRAFDARPLWRAAARGATGWEEEARRSKRLASDLAAVAVEAWRRAGLAPSRQAGCAVGSLSGFGHVAEGIERRLATKGPAWLEPEAFVHYPAHVVAARVCVDLGLDGAATTFLGPRAGDQALRQALRSLRLRRHRVYLAGAYEAATPSAAARFAELGVAVDPEVAEAAFVVLIASSDATPGGMRMTPTADVLSNAGSSPTLSPFLAIAERLAARSDGVQRDPGRAP
jgi:3-oxoacyl-(acyl-carrier-protein) synthase